MFHLANQEEGIWEFRKGPLRIFCFMDHPEHLTILTHGIVKKSQTIRKQDINAAIYLKKQYLIAKQAGKIKLVESDNE